MSHHISGLSPSPPDSPKSPSRTPLSRCRCSGSQAPFSYLLSFRVSAKIWRMEFPRGNSEPLQLSMRQCQAAFGQRLPSSPSRGCGAGGGGGGGPGAGAWRGGRSRACAASSSGPRFSMGSPIRSSDSPERAAAAAGLGRRDSRGI